MTTKLSINPYYYKQLSQIMLQKLIFIAALLLVVSPISVPCSDNCFCQTGTFTCQVCLEYYFQVYSISSKACECLPGFQMTPELVSYCHPYNCQKSFTSGCATCYPHATLKYFENYQYYNCTCDKNYYLNLNSYLCSCLSNQQPTRFYEDMSLQKCLACPLGCLCNSGGCVSCNSSTLREIMSNQYYSTCYCKKPNLEVDGVCRCAPNCVCAVDGTITCNPSSNRILVVDEWICEHPYIQVNGTCLCINPYIIVTTLGYQKCVCMSKVNYTQYYEANGICYKCGRDSVCDATGCVSGPSLSVSVFYESCICKTNYIYVAPDCKCIQPYQLKYDNFLNPECACMSFRLPQLYYSSPSSSSSNFCGKCPLGCSCDSKGCSSCSDPLRIYKSLQIGINFSVCVCAPNSIQIAGKCFCKPLFIYDQTSKSCLCRNISDVMYYNKDRSGQECVKCPLGCVCNNFGCSSCIAESRRAITSNSESVNVCNCQQGFQQINQLCVCNTGFTLVDDICKCIDPYEVVEGVCQCKSLLNNTSYYYDDFQKQCKKCPIGCICNVSGCIDCGSDFLRTIKYSVITFKYRCPCLQNAFLVGDYCTVCTNNSYSEYLGVSRKISCVKCVQCATCDRYGCITCPQNMTLQNKSCLCQNTSLINKDGYCVCPQQQYLIDDECQPCPFYCISCIRRNRTVVCTSCNTNDHRQNWPQQKCPCIQNYKQSSTPSSYCCQLECQQCDATGCLSCPQFTYRTLVNGSCVCTNGFVEQLGHVCLCPNGYYLLNNQCFQCPIECLSCVFNITENLILCETCRQNTNRIFQDDRCVCKPNFSQTPNFKSQFCYATFCSSFVLNCSSCLSPWEIDLVQGICICKKGFWVQGTGNCTQCIQIGCLSCLNESICLQCDQEANFYLVRTQCIKVTNFEYLAIQTINQNLIIQCPLENSLPYLQQMSASLNVILKSNPKVLYDQVKFNILQKKLLKNGTLLSVTLQNLKQTYKNVIISYLFSVNSLQTSANSKSELQLKQSKTLTVNIKMDTLYSEQSFDLLQKTQRIGLYIYVIITMLTAFGFYILGFKHNQTCFFMQTISFLAFVIPDPQLETAMFLYNVRFSYYSFSQYNALSELIPQYYIQSSEGNYRYLATDANIIRNIGIPLILAMVVAGSSIILRVLHFVTRNKSLIQPAGLAVLWKKVIYRMIEFFYKTLMFPLVFFSFQNIYNWNTTTYIDDPFKLKCCILSIIIVSIYLLITVYQYFCQLISVFNKRQSVKQFLNVVFSSWIIIGALHHPNIILLLIIVFVFSELHFIRWKIQDVLVHQITNILRVVIVIFQIICVILACTVKRKALIGFFCVTLLLQITLMVYKAIVDRHVNMISKLTSSALNEQQEIQTQADRDLSISKQ